MRVVTSISHKGHKLVRVVKTYAVIKFQDEPNLEASQGTQRVQRLLLASDSTAS
jgi:hypothetical protein